MKKPIEFSEYGKKHKLRAMDFMKKTPEYFDKKMSTILTCMEYSEALANKTVSKELQLKMHGLIDDTFAGFIKVLNQERPEYQTIVDNIAIIKNQESTFNLLHAYECICIQLTVLASMSRPLPIQATFEDAFHSNEKIFAVSVDKTDTHLDMRRLIYGREFTHHVIPVYSANATIGFNTILFSVFHNYSAVGVGEKPHLVHDKWLENRPTRLLAHDYGHSYSLFASREKDPETFEQFRKIYFELFENKKQNKIDDKTFKTSLLVLFFLVFDSAPSHPFADFKALEHFINQIDYMFIIDFQKPLQDAGYVIDSKDALRKVLLTVVQEFLMRYPELKISPLATVKSLVEENKVTEIQPVLETIPQIEPEKPVVPLTPMAQENESIIKPVIDFLDYTAEKIAVIANSQDPALGNYLKFHGAIGKLMDCSNHLKNEIHDGRILDSTTIADTLQDFAEAMKKLPLLRRLLKTAATPPLDFDKEYAAVLTSIDTHAKTATKPVENPVTVTTHSLFKAAEKPSNAPEVIQKDVENSFTQSKC